MSSKKKAAFDPVELDKMMKQLEAFRPAPEKPRDNSYFNPWNLNKKKSSGKQTICASLPEELPE